MNSTTSHNLRHKLIRVFLLQIGFISVMALGGVYAAKLMLENVMIRAALESEASHFWERYDQNPEFHLPDVSNLLGFLAVDGDLSNVPEAFYDLNPGLNRVLYDNAHPIVFVDDHQNARLYLIFDEASVSRLALVFGILPLASVLIILYLSAWISYRMAHKAISPMSLLANRVANTDLKDGQWVDIPLEDIKSDSDIETLSLINAIEEFAERLESFVDRERQFTRDASHELRTPIAVLSSSLELLERKFKDEEAKPVIERMQRTITSMQSLIETLLVLAREGQTTSLETVNVNKLLKEKLSESKDVYKDKQLDEYFTEQTELTIQAPEKLLEVLMNNLITNAYNYTDDGEISASVTSTGFWIADTGVGINKEEIQEIFKPFYRADKQRDESNSKKKGYGLGLSIVKKICDRCNWKISVDKERKTGTKIIVELI